MASASGPVQVEFWRPRRRSFAAPLPCERSCSLSGCQPAIFRWLADQHMSNTLVILLIIGRLIGKPLGMKALGSAGGPARRFVRWA